MGWPQEVPSRDALDLFRGCACPPILGIVML